MAWRLVEVGDDAEGEEGVLSDRELVGVKVALKALVGPHPMAFDMFGAVLDKLRPHFARAAEKWNMS